MQEQQILNQMIALSEKKLEMLTKLKEYSEKQNRAFQEQNLDSVENILNKKDEIIQYVRKLDDAFLMASDNLKELLEITSLEDLSKTSLIGRKELKILIEDITAMVESIIQLEKSSYENASGMKKEIAEKIKGVNTGRRYFSISC